MTTAVADAAAAARRAVGDVIAGRALKAFYFCVLAVALVGSSLAAKHWLGWWLPFAFLTVALYELGGVALSVYGDARRKRGERAILARLIGAAFAAGAVAINLLGHKDAAGHLTGSGYVFAGLSAAGYGIWLLESGANRRGARREAGKLAETPPAYGVYQWLRHPWLTRRARALAVANAEARLVEQITSRESGGTGEPTTPLLGRAASLAAAVAQVAAERRLAAIRASLRTRIAAGVDPRMAKIAVNTYDLGQVAAGLASDADYPALTALLGAELVPARIAATMTARRRRSWLHRQRPETALPALETAPAPVRTSPTLALPAAPTGPAWPGSAPAGARRLPILPPAPRHAAVPAPPALRNPEPVETGPETAETDPTDLATVMPPPEPDQGSDDGKDLAPPVPAVEAAMLPHLAKVMRAHGDWPITISLPGRHPEALTYAKIKAAAGITGQQTAADIRTALLSLSHHPGAQAYVEANAPANASA